MVIRNFKDKLSDKSVSVGSWITLANNGIAEIFANAGFDWLVIDLEHSVISIDQAGDLIRTIDACGVPALVRLTSNDRNQIKRILDAGANGIVVPNINSAQEAESAVASTRYPPRGRRGVGLARAQKYGSGFDDYLNWQEDGLVVLVQIENCLALDHLDEIFSVDGVDGFIVGPYDLSCSMGIPGDFDHPDFKAAMSSILAASARTGCPPGIHSVEPNVSAIEEALENGFKLIAYSADIRILDVGARQGVNFLLRKQ